MPSDKHGFRRYTISRRAFLEAAAAAGLTGLACEGATDPVTVPADLNPEGLVSLIEGLTTPVQMERLGGFGTERVFSGGNSHPRELIETFSWYMGSSGLPIKFVDFGEEIELRFTTPGKATIELRASSLADRSTASAIVTIDVLPPALSGSSNYEETQVAFFRGDYVNELIPELGKQGALYFMDRDSPELTSRIIRAGTYNIDAGRISWEPSATKLAFVAILSDADSDAESALLTYNTTTGRSTTITAGPYVMTPHWSPQGDWLAYRTSERDLEKAEIACVRPDGSEKYFLAGQDGPTEYFWGAFPTFDPTGERLAIGSFEGEGNIVMVDDPWGARYKTELLSQSQIRDFVIRMAGQAPSWDFRTTFGRYGLCWSPGGEHMVFTIALHGEVGADEESFDLAGIARARVDGTGEIEFLDDEYARNPSYSPDETCIFYEKFDRLHRANHIWRVSADGTSHEDLTLASGAPPKTWDYAATR